MKQQKKKTFEFLEKRTLHELILFCLFNIEDRKQAPTVERLVAECFTLFPKPFAMKGYPKWPDSRKLDRTLRSLRRKKLIKGDPKASFTLTEHGKKEVGEMLKEFRQKKLL